MDSREKLSKWFFYVLVVIVRMLSHFSCVFVMFVPQEYSNRVFSSQLEMINFITRGFQILFIFSIGCHSGPQPSDNDVGILKKDLQMCNRKLTQEQTLHKHDKSRLKIHLKNTRHNNQVYQRMLKVRIKF